jgi:hypothetical protein
LGYPPPIAVSGLTSPPSEVVERIAGFSSFSPNERREMSNWQFVWLYMPCLSRGIIVA